MPRRGPETLPDDGPPKKRTCNDSIMSSFTLKNGEYLKDITGKQWKLGKAVGVGGFGEIYLASDPNKVSCDSEYVAKVEDHKNGPLFVEMNCYLRIAKAEMIEEWKKERGISSLGMPHYVASGSHIHKGEKYRFLILPKYDKDLEKLLKEKKILNMKTVLTISMQILDVLEYIHSKGYIHSDIKASNILLNNKVSKTPKVPKFVPAKSHITNPIRTCRLKKSTRVMRNLRRTPNINYYDEQKLDFEEEVEEAQKPKEKQADQVYLLDYGLASKFLTSNGEHKPFCADERKAHAGTILFCSRDAHKGVPSRRSDLESLGYNIIYWLTGNLPWADDGADPEIVAKKKQRAMADIEYFLKKCFAEAPKFLMEYFKYMQRLQFQEKPDYNYCKNICKQGLKQNGYKNDSRFDLDNLEISRIKKKKKLSENLAQRKFVYTFSRQPLMSNIPIKPSLRKKIKNKPPTKTKWFKDLTDPEKILKQAKEKKHTENETATTNITELNIFDLNPTYAMLDVYYKCLKKVDPVPSCKGDENIKGYTQPMLYVLQKIKRRKERGYEKMAKTRTSMRKRKFIPLKSPPKPKKVNSVTNLRKDHLQTRKTVILRRSYSLRG